MYCIEIPKEINKTFTLFYHLGLWHHGDEPTVKETRIKLFYSIYYFLFLISIIAGAFKSVSVDEAIYLLECVIVGALFLMKLLYIIWKQKEVLEVLTRLGVYPIEDRGDFTLVNHKINKFMKLASFLFIVVFVAACSIIATPLFRSDRELFIKIAFPLDWKNDNVAFWMATGFISSVVIMTMIPFLFSVIIWLAMFQCALRYEILGSEIRNIGVMKTTEPTINKRKMLVQEEQNLFLRKLIAAIDSHQHTKQLTQQVETFCSNFFFVEIISSGLCICGSIYCLAFSVGENFVEHFIHVLTLVYNISEIFMITYLGNEIVLASDRLSYCVFESNWIDQPQATKKYIMVLSELLKQPHVIVIGYLYPLTLETFRGILNFAYNSFNILKNLN